MAYRQACLNAIEYLKKFGYSGAQAYSILGTAPVQGHISGVVDVPNACATLWLPTEIFDFDINPTAAGPVKFIDGSADARSRPTRSKPQEPCMPTYDYACPACGGFEALRSLSQRDEPALPGLRHCLPRVFVAAPRLACLSSETRRAHETNERASHAPRSSRDGSYGRLKHRQGWLLLDQRQAWGHGDGAHGAKAFPLQAALDDQSLRFLLCCRASLCALLPLFFPLPIPAGGKGGG